MASSYAVIENLQEQSQSTTQGVQKVSSSSPRWSIYKVHEDIRNFNKDAYSPLTISIGPFHSSNQEPKTMEADKRQYMNSFLKRIDVKQEEMRVCPEAYDYYRGSSYDEKSLSERLLLDSCFIVELFLRQQGWVHPTEEDKIIKNPSKILLVQRDLLLLENQIPFCVLKQLYSQYRDKEYHIERDSLFSLTQLALKFFQSILPGVNPQALKRNNNADIVHLLDLVHKCYEASMQKPRNLIALEQCCSERRQLMSSYALLMDRLINTSEDVELLEDNLIIRNNLGCNQDVANLFNNLCKGVNVNPTDYIFAGLSAKVNRYCSQLWSKMRANFKRKYYSNPVNFAAFALAIVALLFTILQTVYTIATYYYTL
ncbi:hypothetical protein F0562_015424 [Nyssa sinensis]|uniref:Uncharacterized protein n=1 Tax=Nyssa sinensis TaxID=561372 RepID=A0A5J4ZHA3_9ASTE|nr:hypothetical protein F0562_015424 [Nyssa sinensis]